MEEKKHCGRGFIYLLMSMGKEVGLILAVRSSLALSRTKDYSGKRSRTRQSHNLGKAAAPGKQETSFAHSLPSGSRFLAMEATVETPDRPDRS